MNRPQANIAILAAAATAGAPCEVAQALTKIALPRREARATTPLTDALYASVDAAFIGQNVYLFCVSENLATVFRAAVYAVKLGRALRLPDLEFITFAQTMGYVRM